jgi:NADPH:quinone reductase-like Zn-dependent oxidoreductase
MNQVKAHRVVVTRHGGPEVLQFVEEELPEPEAGEVRVKVLAAGVSAFDLMSRRSGLLPGSPHVPFTLGVDVVGVADKLGPSVTSLELGQRVGGATWSLGIGGGYTEYICLPASDLVPVPPQMDPAEAVCLIVNYLTAHLHLFRYGQAKMGERVLVHGAAGGVGSALLDLGRMAGMEMYGTASKRNHDVVTAFGATPIDYRSEDFVRRISELTGDGVDVAIDPVGGASQLWRSYKTLRRGGRLIWLGAAATKDKGLLRVGALSMLTVFLLKRFPDGKSVPAAPDLAIFSKGHNDWYRDTLAQLLEAAAAGKLQPVVAERIPLAEATRAHELLEHGGYAGKVVLIAGS